MPLTDLTPQRRVLRHALALPRELEARIMQLALAGYRDRVISEVTGVSRRTVERVRYRNGLKKRGNPPIRNPRQMSQAMRVTQYCSVSPRSMTEICLDAGLIPSRASKAFHRATQRGWIERVSRGRYRLCLDGELWLNQEWRRSYEKC